MQPVNDKNNKKTDSFKDFLAKPLIRTDSKTLQYSGLGIQLAVTILIFLFIGVWLDGIFNSKFVFTLILTFIGFGGGFYSFYLNIKKLTGVSGSKSYNNNKNT